MNGAERKLRGEFTGIAVFVGIIWAVFIVNWIVFPIDFNSFGLTPRTLFGAVGIVAMPFLHADWGHLVSNTIPLLVLLVLLVGSKARSWETVVEIILLGGVLLWLFGRNATHVGASGLIFGLVTFLIASGLLERRIIPLIVSLIVGFLYGGTLFSGVLPVGNAGISWDGHLWGAVAGAVIAWFLTRPRANATTATTGAGPGVQGDSTSSCAKISDGDLATPRLLASSAATLAHRTVLIDPCMAKNPVAKSFVGQDRSWQPQPGQVVAYTFNRRARANRTGFSRRRS